MANKKHAYVEESTVRRMVHAAWSGVEVTGFVGHGGFSDVWGLSNGRVVKVTSVNTVAIMLGGASEIKTARKYLLKEAELTQRFGIEKNPNIIRCYSAVTLDDSLRRCSDARTAYVLLELERLEELSLINVRNQQDVEKLLRDAARGLGVLHNSIPQIIHRDCTTRNIFRSPQRRCFVLGDLGVARSAQGSRKSHTHLCVFSDVHPPEVKFPDRDHPLQPCTDLFILGASVLKLAQSHHIALSPSTLTLLHRMKENQMSRRIQSTRELIYSLPPEVGAPADRKSLLELLRRLHGSDRQQELVSNGSGTTLSHHLRQSQLDALRPVLLAGNYKAAAEQLKAHENDPVLGALYALTLALGGADAAALEEARNRLRQLSSPQASLVQGIIDMSLGQPAAPSFQSAYDRSSGALKALAQYYWGCTHLNAGNKRAAEASFRLAAQGGCKTAALTGEFLAGKVTESRYKQTRLREVVETLTA